MNHLTSSNLNSSSVTQNEGNTTSEGYRGDSTRVYLAWRGLNKYQHSVNSVAPAATTLMLTDGVRTNDQHPQPPKGVVSTLHGKTH